MLALWNKLVIGEGTAYRVERPSTWRTSKSHILSNVLKILIFLGAFETKMLIQALLKYRYWSGRHHSPKGCLFSDQ